MQKQHEGKNKITLLILQKSVCERKEWELKIKTRSENVKKQVYICMLPLTLSHWELHKEKGQIHHILK